MEKEPEDAGDDILGYLGGVESLQKEKISESTSDLRFEDDVDINDDIICNLDEGETGVVAEEEAGLLMRPPTPPPSVVTPPTTPLKPLVAAGGVEKVDGAFEGEFSLDCECASVS